MKRTFFLLSLLALPFLSGAQDFIDEIFKKYSASDDITSITISKELLNFALSIDNDNEAHRVMGNISDLKILVSEHGSRSSVGFTNDIRNSLDKNSFINLMEIRGKDKVNFYAKKDNDKIVHLLLIASDGAEEVLLSIKGQFTKEDLANLGKHSKCKGDLHHLSLLRDLEF